MATKKKEETTDPKKQPQVNNDPISQPQSGKKKRVVSPDPSKRTKKDVWDKEDVAREEERVRSK